MCVQIKGPRQYFTPEIDQTTIWETMDLTSNFRNNEVFVCRNLTMHFFVGE